MSPVIHKHPLKTLTLFIEIGNNKITRISGVRILKGKSVYWGSFYKELDNAIQVNS